MIGRTNAVVGEIDKKVEITFTVEGAKGDNITITDASGEIVGNVIFDTDAVSKEYTMMIDDGAEYTFTSSVAKDTETGESDYSKVITLSKDMPYEKESSLPEGYAELEYIESTGTQYIDTGIIPKLGLEFKIDAEFTSIDSSGRTILFQNMENDAQYSLGIGSSNNMYCYLTNSSGNMSNLGSKTLTNGTRCSIDVQFNQSSQFYYVDEELIGSATVSAIANRTMTLKYLASTSSSGVNTISAGIIKTYSFKIYDGDIIIRDFIPCYRKSDYVAGLYDMVNGVFYTNQGTGEFIGGKRVDIPCVKVMPDGALYWYGNEVERLSSFGAEWAYSALAPTITRNTNNVKFSLSSNTTCGIASTDAKVDTNNITTMKFNVASYNSDVIYPVAFENKGSNFTSITFNSRLDAFTKTGITDVNINNDVTTSYIGVYLREGGNIVLNAIWLE